jgi:hypothetical protein
MKGLSAREEKNNDPGESTSGVLSTGCFSAIPEHSGVALQRARNK